MSKPSEIFCLFIVLAAVMCHSYFLNNEKVFRFTKKSSGFDFECKLDNGDRFVGEGLLLSEERPDIYFMMSPDGRVYWVRFTPAELQAPVPFEKTVQRVHIHREKNVLATFKDGPVNYIIYNHGGVLVHRDPVEKFEKDTNDVMYNVRKSGYDFIIQTILLRSLVG